MATKSPCDVSWKELRSKIGEAFSSHSVDVDAMKLLLASYNSSREDWQTFANFDPHRYTRNLVDEGNGSYNLILICWGEGHASSIHDHADSHCFMKVVEGSLQEVVYASPSQSQPVRELHTNNLHLNDVTYIHGEGVHRIQNPSHTDPAISLHIYSPPITLCHSFEERTGRPHQCCVSFYSKGGNLCSNYSSCTT